MRGGEEDIINYCLDYQIQNSEISGNYGVDPNMTKVSSMLKGGDQFYVTIKLSATVPTHGPKQ